MPNFDYIFDQFKKGVMTSEFWLLIITTVYNAVMYSYDPTRPFTQQLTGLALIAGSAVWAIARTWLQRHRTEIVRDLTPANPEPPAPTGVPTA